MPVNKPFVPLAVVILSALLFAPESPAQLAEQSSTTQKTQRYRDMAVSIVKLERLEKWVSAGSVFEPKEAGQEILVIHLKLEFDKPVEKGILEGGEPVILEDYDLQDSEGTWYVPHMNKLKFFPNKGLKNTEVQLPFAVPIGKKFGTLRLGNVKFNFAEADRSAPKQ